MVLSMTKLKLSKSPHAGKVVSLPSTPEEQAKFQLKRFEEADRKIREIKEKHDVLFAEIESLEAAKEEARESLKRLFFTKEGPPEGKAKTTTYAKGEYFEVEVQYKKRADYYDPKKLPLHFYNLLGPGNEYVTEVDTEKVKALGWKENEAALVTGAWMVPAVSVKRR